MAVKSSVLQDCQTLQGVNIVMSSYMVNSLLKKRKHFPIMFMLLKEPYVISELLLSNFNAGTV